LFKGPVYRKLIARAKELIESTTFDRSLPVNRELTLFSDFVIAVITFVSLLPLPATKP
jgi:hypothetical protein